MALPATVPDTGVLACASSGTIACEPAVTTTPFTRALSADAPKWRSGSSGWWPPVPAHVVQRSGGCLTPHTSAYHPARSGSMRTDVGNRRIALSALAEARATAWPFQSEALRGWLEISDGQTGHLLVRAMAGARRGRRTAEGPMGGLGGG